LANLQRHWLGETKAAREELLHADAPQELEELAEAAHPPEDMDRLARVLKAGTI
jgi:hypothetical protein